MHRPRTRLVAAGCAGFAALVGPAVAQFCTGYSELAPAPNFQHAGLRGVSPGGTFGAGYSSLGPNGEGERATRWFPGGAQLIGDLGGGDSEAWAVSSNGGVLVGWSLDSSFVPRPFRWTSGGGMIDLLPGGVANGFGEAHDVSADGDVVVGRWFDGAGGSTAFRWTQATGPAPINLAGTWAEAYGVSADGAVVVGRYRAMPGPNRAFRWDAAGGLQVLGTAGGVGSEAWAISADGSTIVGGIALPNGSARPFRWTQATGTQLMLPFLGASMVALGVSEDGQRVVGTYTDLAGDDHPFVWSETTGCVDLAPRTPRPAAALAITGTSTLVGIAFEGATPDPSAFRIDLTPIGAPYCASLATNSTGCIGLLQATGSANVASNSLRLEASSLPSHALGIFIVARQTANVPQAGGGSGTLCLGGPIGRFVGPGQVQDTGAAGSFQLTLDLQLLPTPTGLVAGQPGETWMFQAWHRDAVAGVATSNFTDPVALTLD